MICKVPDISFIYTALAEFCDTYETIVTMLVFFRISKKFNYIDLDTGERSLDSKSSMSSFKSDDSRDSSDSYHDVNVASISDSEDDEGAVIEARIIGEEDAVL